MNHPGRKLFHLLGGIGLLSIYLIAGREQALWVYAGLAGLALVLEIARMRFSAANDLVFRHFGAFIRKSERSRMTGTIPYILGVGLSLLLYRVEIATAAICFLACGDVAATTVGERYGRTRIAGEKSLEGTFAFFAASLAAGSVLIALGNQLPFIVLMAGAAIAAGVELLPVRLNDNLVIPLIAGGAMTLITRTGWP